MTHKELVIIKYFVKKAKSEASIDFVPEFWLRSFFSQLSPETKRYINKAVSPGGIKDFHTRLIKELSKHESKINDVEKKDNRSRKGGLDYCDQKRDGEANYRGRFGVWSTDKD